MFNAIDALLASVTTDTYLTRYSFLCSSTCEGHGLCSALT